MIVIGNTWLLPASQPGASEAKFQASANLFRYFLVSFALVISSSISARMRLYEGTIQIVFLYKSSGNVDAPNPVEESSSSALVERRDAAL